MIKASQLTQLRVRALLVIDHSFSSIQTFLHPHDLDWRRDYRMIVHEMQNHCKNYFSPHRCSTPMFCSLSIYWSRILLILEVWLRTLAKWETLRAHWSWVSFLPTHHRCNFVKAFVVGEQKPDGREKKVKSVVRRSCCVQDWKRRRIDSGVFILSLQWNFIWSRRCGWKEGNPWNKICVQKETSTQLCVAVFSHGLLAHWHGKKKKMKRAKALETIVS